MRIVVEHPRDVRVRFGYSPLVEAVFSLHVLRRPRHHPLQTPWIRRMRGLPPGLRADVAALDRLLADDVPDAVAAFPPAERPDFDAELERLATLPDEVVATFPGPDPAATHERLCGLLADYWAEAFAAEWGRVEPRLATAADRAAAVADRRGLHGFLATMAPRVRCDGDRRFGVGCAAEESTGRDGEVPLVPWATDGEAWFTPSVFSWPHHWLAGTAGGPSLMAYPVHALGPAGRREPPPPDELVRLLRACGDDVRLRVLRMLSGRPQTTTELSAALGMTASGVSKHVRTLSDAGLVQGRREGYYVVYSLREDRIEPLAATLHAYLGG